jgi:hypothetical protein
MIFSLLVLALASMRAPVCWVVAPARDVWIESRLRPARNRAGRRAIDRMRLVPDLLFV